MSNFTSPCAAGHPPTGKGVRAPGGLNHEHRAHGDERYISRRELRQLFPVSDMSIWRWQRDPEVAFPAPVKLGRNGRNFWWYPAILEWERRRAEGSKPEGALAAMSTASAEGDA